MKPDMMTRHEPNTAKPRVKGPMSNVESRTHTRPSTFDLLHRRVIHGSLTRIRPPCAEGTAPHRHASLSWGLALSAALLSLTGLPQAAGVPPNPGDMRAMDNAIFKNRHFRLDHTSLSSSTHRSARSRATLSRTSERTRVSKGSGRRYDPGSAVAEAAIRRYQASTRTGAGRWETHTNNRFAASSPPSRGTLSFRDSAILAAMATNLWRAGPDRSAPSTARFPGRNQTSFTPTAPAHSEERSDERAARPAPPPNPHRGPIELPHRQQPSQREKSPLPPRDGAMGEGGEKGVEAGGGEVIRG